MSTKIIKAHYVDCYRREIYAAELGIESNKITHIRRISDAVEGFILPGWVDAHIHIESSMLVPTEFAKIAVLHGTVATVSDPHEIANVLGVVGVEFMIQNASQCPFKFNFGVPSCVPATDFETAGACIEVKDAEKLFLEYPQIKYLSEVMNYPGVVSGDKKMVDLIALAKRLGKQVDGHAPGLRGEILQKYIDAGISTDHECYTYEEGLEKLERGMKIIIREGSAAKNFEALIPLLHLYPDKIMFCSDDKHPDDLMEGHINLLVARAVEEGMDLFDVIKAASFNPIQHYGLEVGMLREGDSADFQIVGNLMDFKPRQVFIEGEEVMNKEFSKMPTVEIPILNHFKRNLLHIDEIKTPPRRKFRTIKAIDHQLVTEEGFFDLTDEKSTLPLKLVNVNRYINTKPAIAFIENFNLKDCAIASSVAHDSHNILAVGTSDELIIKVINAIVEDRGGISFASQEVLEVLPLPIGGIMSDRDCEWVGDRYKELDQLTKDHGCTLHAPYMTLSFLALLVIPKMKLSDRGLFDGERFQFVSVGLD